MTAKAAKTNKKAGRTASKEVRQRQLIEATIESIAKFGVAGTTTTTVTGFAGLSMGIVNYHFKNKETLFEETLRFLAEEHREQWQTNYANADPTPQARLLAVVDAHFHPRICSRKKMAAWFGFYGMAGSRASYRRIMSEIDQQRWDVTIQLLQELIDDGGYAQSDAEAINATLESILDGFSLNILIYPDEYTRDSCKLRVRDFLATTFPKHFDRPGTEPAKG